MAFFGSADDAQGPLRMVASLSCAVCPAINNVAQTHLLLCIHAWHQIVIKHPINAPGLGSVPTVYVFHHTIYLLS